MKKEHKSNEYKLFQKNLKERIHSAQYEALKVVKKELINFYWDIGKLIVKQQEKYSWGKSVEDSIAEDLQTDFPGITGYSSRNLWYMRNFYLNYKDNVILQPTVAEISWTKNIVIFEKCKDDLEWEFYIKMTKKFGWSKNVLIHQIENQSYEKYPINQTNLKETLPTKYKNQAKLAVKDEYTFDFLELSEEDSHYNKFVNFREISLASFRVRTCQTVKHVSQRKGSVISNPNAFCWTRNLLVLRYNNREERSFNITLSCKFNFYFLNYEILSFDF